MTNPFPPAAPAHPFGPKLDVPPTKLSWPQAPASPAWPHVLPPSAPMMPPAFAAAPTWASVAPIAPPAVIIPPGTAVDKHTGEMLLDIDGNPYNADQMLLDWHEAKEQLELAKAYERDLRDKVVACFTDPEKLKGTERVELGNGYQLKTVKGLSYTVKSFKEEVPLYNAVTDVLNKIATMTHDAQGEPLSPAEGQRIAATVIKWSCDLSTKVYDQMPAAYKAVLDTVIEMKAKAPSVEIVAPRGVDE